jgi:aerobic-type carbon monoxide dehydrogenase small subunit (CoxS/CutS family)
MSHRRGELPVVIAAKPFERTVSFTLDGQPMSFATWSDTSALWAIRYLGRSDRPERGCEVGSCGTCECSVNGAPTRLCQLVSTNLDGCTILT